jgi:hypothetical protein
MSLKDRAWLKKLYPRLLFSYSNFISQKYCKTGSVLHAVFEGYLFCNSSANIFINPRPACRDTEEDGEGKRDTGITSGKGVTRYVARSYLRTYSLGRWRAGHQETIPHLETTCEIHHIYEEENVLISGTREKSAAGDSTEPKQ